MELLNTFLNNAVSFFRIGAITGFLATTTLVINLDRHTFYKILGKRAKSFWWLFLMVALISFFILLYIFTIVFEKFNHWGYFELFKDLIVKWRENAIY